MNDIKAAIYSKLSGTSAITAIVGSKIYAVAAPQDQQPPYVVFEFDNTKATHHLRGTTEFWKAVLTVVGYANSSSTAADLSDAVRSCLDSFQGTIGDLSVRHCLLMEIDESYAPPKHGTRFGDYLTISVYDIGWHAEAYSLIES